MALAIRFEQLIRDSVVKDQADLARLAQIARARVTEIMDLLLLAPEIQEEIGFLVPVNMGKIGLPKPEFAQYFHTRFGMRSHECMHSHNLPPEL